MLLFAESGRTGEVRYGPEACGDERKCPPRRRRSEEGAKVAASGLELVVLTLDRLREPNWVTEVDKSFGLALGSRFSA